VDNSPRDVCNHGRDPLIGFDGASRHAHHPASHRIASALAVFCGHDGEVTTMANAHEHSRQSLCREAHEAANVVDSDAAQARIDEFQQHYWSRCR
jgi:hypothetical protein